MGVNFFDNELRPSADIGCSVNKQLMIWLSQLKWWWPNDHPSSKFVSFRRVCMEWTCRGCLMISGFNTPFRHEVRVNLIINSDSFTVMWGCTPTQQFSSNVVNPETSPSSPAAPISASHMDNWRRIYASCHRCWFIVLLVELNSRWFGHDRQ